MADFGTFEYEREQREHNAAAARRAVSALGFDAVVMIAADSIRIELHTHADAAQVTFDALSRLAEEFHTRRINLEWLAGRGAWSDVTPGDPDNVAIVVRGWS